MKRKKRKKPTKSHREWLEENRERFERTDRLLRERIAYHRGKLADERAARGEA